MKTTVAAIALVLGASAPVFAMTAEQQLHDNVSNHVQRIDSAIVLPDLTTKDLAFLKGVVDDSSDSDSEKASKIRFYISNL